MIPMPSGMRVWLATGVTDMRRGMQGLALQVQEGLKRDPHMGDVFVFRGRRGDLVKILWHDGVGFSLYAKRLERGRFLWPSTVRRRSIRCPQDRRSADRRGAGRRGGGDHAGPAWLHARRDRLAAPAADLAAGRGRMRTATD
jgi:transposase